MITAMRYAGHYHYAFSLMFFFVYYHTLPSPSYAMIDATLFYYATLITLYIDTKTRQHTSDCSYAAFLAAYATLYAIFAADFLLIIVAAFAIYAMPLRFTLLMPLDVTYDADIFFH